jgi:hypothetical protein
MRRQRIDTMIDAHVWMRRTARTQGEWPRHENPEAPADAAYGGFAGHRKYAASCIITFEGKAFPSLQSPLERRFPLPLRAGTPRNAPKSGIGFSTSLPVHVGRF